MYKKAQSAFHRLFKQHVLPGIVYSASGTTPHKVICHTYSQAERHSSAHLSPAIEFPNMVEEFSSNPKNVDEWNRMWESGKYDPMHDSTVSKYITNHYEELRAGSSGSLKIFFPLCGKDVGMKWLADKGHTIVGVEGSAHAVTGFFKDQSLEYTKEACSAVKGDLYKSKSGDIRIYRCDFFKFNSAVESGFDAAWDRGAFGALEPTDRQRYADLVLTQTFLKPGCRYFIETFEGEADEGLIPESLLKSLFKIGDRFTMSRIEYDKEDPNASEDDWVMMIQVHLLKGI